MLANVTPTTEAWWYMEVTRTGSSTLERTLRHLWPTAKAIYAKHWPLLPPVELRQAVSLITVRNPYSRAISCWQYFTKPGDQTFLEWTEARLTDGFCDGHIEARPQAFWFDLWRWDFVLQQEYLQQQFWQFMAQVQPAAETFPLHRYNDINGPWVNRVRAETSRELPWEAYYCPASEKNIQKLYDRDFESLSKLYSRKFPGTLVLS